MGGDPTWDKTDLDFDARGRLVIHNRELANRILDAFNSNGSLRLVHEHPRPYVALPPSPFPPRPLPMPDPAPRPDGMCDCEFMLDKLNGIGFPPSPNA
jgi:hypothetical protein